MADPLQSPAAAGAPPPAVSSALPRDHALPGAAVEQPAFTISGGTIFGPVVDHNAGTINYTYHVSQTSLPDLKNRKNRRALLTNVRNFWIKGVLEQSNRDLGLINLGKQEQVAAVVRPWDLVLQTDAVAARTIPPDTPIIQVFDAMRGALLILGDPGAGKTTTLLELARDLLLRAEQDDDHPMPVIFNLSSWAEQRLPLQTWLVNELSAKYQVPKKVGRTWVTDAAVIPLLDGLDEVRLDQRQACVEAINRFRDEHGLEPIVVCSRRADYEALSAKLKLDGAILLQPLTGDQIDTYLNRAGDDLAAVCAALQDDASLRELAETPLLLSVMILAYRGLSRADLARFDSLEARRTHLFDTYIERMFKRRGVNQRYPPPQTLRWLHWLAREMQRHGQTVFLIEQLQPNWLPSRRLLWKYTLLDRGCFGLACAGLFGNVAAILAGIIGGMQQGVTAGLLYALLAGVIGAIVTFPLVSLFGGTMSPTQRGAHPYRQAVVHTILGVFAVWFIVGLMSGLFAVVVGISTGGLAFGIRFAVAFGLLAGLYFGLFGGLAGGLAGGPHIRPRAIMPVEKLRWSWRRLIRSLLVGLGLGAGVALFVVPVGAIIRYLLPNFAGVQFTWIGTLKFGGPIGLAAGLVSGLVGSGVETKVTPNQGIRRSGRSALVAGLIVGLVISVGFAWVGLLSEGPYASVTVAWIGGLSSGLLGAIIGALAFGGYAVLSHLALRFVLWRAHAMPWRYERFLDYAAERIFLRKVGGGYIFVHRLLLEHFAEREQKL